MRSHGDTSCHHPWGGPSSPSLWLAQLRSLWSSRADRECSCFPAGPSGSEFQRELEGQSSVRHHLTPLSSGETLPMTLQMRRLAQGCFVMATSPWNNSGERYLGVFSYVVAHASKSLTRKICVYENPRHGVPIHIFILLDFGCASLLTGIAGPALKTVKIFKIYKP